MISILLSFFLFLTSNTALANVYVALFSELDKNGQVVEFTPGGKYSHIALKTPYGWLHADPREGVVLSESPLKIGPIFDIFMGPGQIDISKDQIRHILEQRFNMRCRWENKFETYCSKLVGQILNIPPEAMSFSHPNWKKLSMEKYRNLLGLSPDRIYEILLDRGYTKVHSKGSCSESLI